MSKKIIKPGEGNVKSALPLVMFDMLIDTDYGLLKLISEEYLDPDIFNLSWFQQHPDVFTKTRELYIRDHPNPLSICITDREKEDDLYDSFIKEQYINIIRISGVTSFARLVGAWEASKEVRPTIVYRSVHEASLLGIISSIDPKWQFFGRLPKISLSDLILNEDINQYNGFYFKSIINDVYLDTLADYIKVKPVYFAYYPFNTTDSQYYTQSESLRTLLKNKNEIRLIDIYNREKLGLEESGGKDDDNSGMQAIVPQ